MMVTNMHTSRPLPLAPGAATLAFLALMLCTGAQAQVPPPPVSPASVQTLEYDANGNFTKLSKAGLATSNSYDSLNRRWKTTDARAKDTLFGYTGREDLSQVTDPRSLVTQYPRNGLGDATGLISPDTGTQTHTLDAAGNLLTRTDARGVLATYSYDALNRMTSAVYTQSGQPAQSILWNYDQTGAGFSYGVGRLTSTQFPAGSATYGYDPLGRLVTSTQTVTSENTVSLTTGYGYDAAGHITSITYPSGRVLNIPHSGGQPNGMSLAAAGGGTTLPLLSDLQFQPGLGGPGPARSWNWQLNSGTMANTRVFDSYGRLVRYPLGGALRDLTYDAADRIIHYTHWNVISGASVPVLNQDFGYDETGRLTSIATGVGSWTIGYDDNGNRSVVNYTGPGGPSTRNYATSASSNRLNSLDSPSRTLGYDAAGNILADDQGQQSIRATIDPSGRVSVINSTVNGANYAYTGYAYNAAGLRVLRLDMGGETCWIVANGRKKCDQYMTAVGIGVVFVYDQEGQLLGEYKLQDGSVMREYVWLQGMPVAVIDGTAASPQISYVQTDHLGAPRTVIDRAGVQRWSWVAEPFGNSPPVEDPVGYGAFTLNLRMPGQYFDVESGLAYNWNRSYDAGLGRYTQSDPIGLQGGINTYAYVGGNPVSYVDPAGLQAQALIRLLPPALVALGIIEASRPKNMSPIEQRQFDRYCTGPGDPCQELKDEARKAIAAAIPKMNNMLNDQTMFGMPGWQTHGNDLMGRISQINAIISLGQKMGCDMSAEIAASSVLYVPNVPLRMKL